MPVIDFSTGQPVKRRVEAPIKEPPAKAQPARRKRGTAAHEMRKALLAKVHIAKTQLGMTDDEYLTLLDSYYNVASAGVLSLLELFRQPSVTWPASSAGKRPAPSVSMAGR